MILLFTSCGVASSLSTDDELLKDQRHDRQPNLSEWRTHFQIGHCACTSLARGKRSHSEGEKNPDSPSTPFMKGMEVHPLNCLVAQTLHHLCRATAVALHLCRIFRLMFSQCRTRIALHPLKCLKRGPVAPFWGVSHLKLAMHIS